VGGGRVLRRYRSGQAAEPEARVMQHVRAHGFPAPEVFDASGPDLVMARLEGPTMLADAGRRPWRLFRHAALLADLHRRLHALPALDGLRQPFGPGPSILHLDFHPDNVMMTADGPVVIDWPNAAVGPPAADVAHTWLILATTEVSWRDVTARAGRAAFLSAFLRGAGRADAAGLLSEVGAYRLGDRNLVGREGDRIERLARRHRGR
jgi:aminoglycoside phosphotransferase (APT) family kinase protein